MYIEKERSRFIDRTLFIGISVLIVLVAFVLVLSSIRTGRAEPVVSLRFPASFHFGAATSAYQIEGAIDVDGKGLSIWDKFTHTKGKIVNDETGDIATNHYQLMEKDVEMMKRLGLKNYRMSLSWSRILSNGTLQSKNQKGIDYYNREIDLLKAAGISVYITLYHWDLPLYLEEEYGGWLNQTMVQYFSDYADLCFKLFSDRVKHWITFNEPWVQAQLAYGTGANAPGRCTLCEKGNSATEPYIVGHNQLLAHAAAVKIFREKYQQQFHGSIGITLNSDWCEPLTNTKEDKEAAQRYLEFFLGWFADPVFFGDYPQVMKDRVGDRLPRFTESEKDLLKNSLDFLGINHYTSRYVASTTDPKTNVNWENDIGSEPSIYDKDHNPIGVVSDAPWLYVVPWGMHKLLVWIKNRYNNPQVMITENGVPVPDENSLSIREALTDDFRLNYLQSYLSEVSKAIMQDQCNVSHYFVWSLMDNFEWAAGYSQRFGIYYVDYKSPDYTRHAKKSAQWYSKLISHYE